MTTYKLLDAIVLAGSMRKAAKAMAITPSALNRRVLLIEEEFGVELFDRTTKGLKLSSAGELVIHHVRQQINDLERVQSKIADLKGLRSGHVTMACSQAAMGNLLPQLIQDYRTLHPRVTFSVIQTDAETAAQMLQDFVVDFSIDFDAAAQPNIRTLVSVPQTVNVLMHPEHDLAQKEHLRLYECLDFPLALPTKTLGLRTLLDFAASQLSLEMQPAIEADNVEFLMRCAEDLPTLTFRLSAASKRMGETVDQEAGQQDTAGQEKAGLISVPLVDRQTTGKFLTINQLKDRSLSVASARFIELLATKLK